MYIYILLFYSNGNNFQKYKNKAQKWRWIIHRNDYVDVLVNVQTLWEVDRYFW